MRVIGAEIRNIPFCFFFPKIINGLECHAKEFRYLEIRSRVGIDLYSKTMTSELLA